MVHRQTLEKDGFRSGIAGALALHAVVAGALVAAALVAKSGHDRWGESADVTGAIQASMVNALPLPPKARPVEKQVLASEDVNQAPAPPPKEATQPPPKPTDIEIKAPTKTPPKAAPKESTAPPPRTPVKPVPRPEVTPNTARHPQPVPDTPKATSGETTATALPSSVAQTRNGTATASVQDRTFGYRYAYYLRIVGQKIMQNYQASEVDASSSVGKQVTVLFTIDRDGVPQEIKVQTRSGSGTLDTSALHAVQRVDSFGPLPAGDHIQILWSFDFKAP
jgi:periplasmic protein TonB